MTSHNNAGTGTSILSDITTCYNPYIEYQLGDINQDNVINIVDIVLLVQIILTEETTEQQLLLSDFNQDGEVNIVDIVQLVNYILNQ